MKDDLFEIPCEGFIPEKDFDPAAPEGRGVFPEGPGEDERFREELLGRIVRLEDKASRAFLCIEEQREQLQVLEDFLNEQERDREKRRSEIQARRKERGLFWKITGGCTLLGLMIIWAGEIAGVGWFLFRTAADLLGLKPVDAAGFLTSVALIALLLRCGKGMVEVIGDDLLDREV